MHALTILIVIAGWLHLSLLFAGATVPVVLKWRTQLDQLDSMSRHIIWTHGGYIMLMILGIACLSIGLPRVLTDGSAVGRGLAGFVCLFWMIRLVIQLFMFRPGALLDRTWRIVGYHALTVLFAFFTGVYGVAALEGV